MNILFVCHGNINRSIAAHIIFQHYYPEHSVDSAGLRKNGVGALITKQAHKTLNTMGYTCFRAHRAKLITEDMIKKAEIVFYFDSGNYKRLISTFPTHTTKYKCLGDLIGEKRIADPHFDNSHTVVFPMIEEAVKKIGDVYGLLVRG